MDRQQNLYLTDTYLLVCDSRVLHVKPEQDGHIELALASNIFHPQGGGQPADHGTVNGVAVEVRTRDGLVVLRARACRELDGIAAGDVVEALVDSQTRLQNSALHTAGHLVHGIGEITWGLALAANNHFPGQARIEFHQGDTELDHRILHQELTIQTRRLIDKDLTIQARTTSGQRRSIEIDGLNCVPCGGTHLRSLGELTEVSISDVKTKKACVRVRYDTTHIASHAANQLETGA